MLKIFFTSDLHGSDECFRKFLNAGALYDVDAVIIGGDISGKMAVPIMERAGQFEACYQGKSHCFTSVAAVSDFEQSLQNRGHYPVRLEGDADERPAAGTPELAALFTQVMKTSVARWLELADLHFRGNGVECYIMLGNDDPSELAELIDQSDVVINPDGRRVLIRDEVEMVSLGYSNLTPFHSHREMPEEQVENILTALADQLTDVRSAIFNVHVPPHDSTLDNAPELDENLRPRLHNGQPNLLPVGSRAVRKLILERQPLLGLHGHVHESGGVTRLGRTLCINPGSSFTAGILHGVVVTIDEGRVCSHELVTS